MTSEGAGPLRWPRPRFSIIANDEDGDGTTYFLLEPSGKPIAMHAWPMPLEELARDLHGEVVRLRSNTGPEGFGPTQSLGLPGYCPEYEQPDLDVLAEDWLREQLTAGSARMRDIEAWAREARIYLGRLKAAAKRLRVERHRVWGRRRKGLRVHRGSFIVWSLPGKYDGTWREEDVLDIDPNVGLEQELTDAAAAIASPERCKIPGCEEEAVGKASFSGLCETHKTEEAQRRNAVAADNRRRRVWPPTETGPEPGPYVTAARTLEELLDERAQLDVRIKQEVATLEGLFHELVLTE